MSPSIKLIREILEAGDLRRLIGEFESDLLECKDKPYRLEEAAQKLELAKDVSAFANAAGGVLIIGYSTRTDAAHGEDRIERVRPFKRDLLDRAQYQQILRDWLWPPLRQLKVEWFQSKEQLGMGVVAIFVPRAKGSEKPILVTKSLLEGRRTEILFGYCERRQSGAVHHTVQRLQSLLRDGELLESEIREGNQPLYSLSEELRKSRPSKVGPEAEDLSDRLEEALRAVKLQELPAFTLAVSPEQPIDLPELFGSRDSRLVQLLEKPPKHRNAGFDLDSDPNSQIVAGKVRRVLIENFNLLEIHRDGTVIFGLSGDMLCWGRRDAQTQWRLINQLALVEIVDLFCKFVSEVFAGQAESRVCLELALLRMNKNGEPCRLKDGAVGALWAKQMVAPGKSGRFSVHVKLGQCSPDRIAVLLLGKVYAWFGLEEDRIPYTKVLGDHRLIDEEAITAIR